MELLGLGGGTPCPLELSAAIHHINGVPTGKHDPLGVWRNGDEVGTGQTTWSDESEIITRRHLEAPALFASRVECVQIAISTTGHHQFPSRAHLRQFVGERSGGNRSAVGVEEGEFRLALPNTP